MAIKYKWLATKLEEQLQVNYVRGIDKLPSENELCQKYRISRQTVRQALRLLESKGLIEKRRGSGSFYTGLSTDTQQNSIGLLFPTDQEYYYPSLINDIKHQLAQRGFDSKVFVTNYNFDTERNILCELTEHPLRGLIVEGICSALPNPNIDLYNKLQLKDCALLFVNQPYQSESSFVSLKDANKDGGNMLTSYLSEHGHTKIAGIFQMDQISGHERYLGYITSHRHITKNTGWYTTKELLGLRENHDTSFLKEFIKDTLSDSTAIICDQDEIAYYLAIELKKAGYSLPEDISIVTFGNTYYCESGVISLTSLSHKIHETSAMAVNMIIEQLKGLPVISKEIPWNLVIRQST